MVDTATFETLNAQSNDIRKETINTPIIIPFEISIVLTATKPI
jgi:hypothetical protein